MVEDTITYITDHEETELVSKQKFHPLLIGTHSTGKNLYATRGEKES